MRAKNELLPMPPKIGSNCKENGSGNSQRELFCKQIDGGTADFYLGLLGPRCYRIAALADLANVGRMTLFMSLEVTGPQLYQIQ